jgi:hypothetical protein
LKFVVSRRKRVGLPVLLLRGLAVLGEEFSIATAYALDRVLKAVGEDGSWSVFNAETDFPRIVAVAGVLICRESLGRFPEGEA